MSQEVKKETCDICNKSFSRKDALRRHKETVHSNQFFVCPICNQTISRKDLLDRHIKNFHNQLPADVYKKYGQPKPVSKVAPKVEETKVEVPKVEVPKVAPKVAPKVVTKKVEKKRILPAWINQKVIDEENEKKEEGVLQETKGNEVTKGSTCPTCGTKMICPRCNPKATSMHSKLINEVAKIKQAVATKPQIKTNKISPTLGVDNSEEAKKLRIEKMKKKREEDKIAFMEKERIRQQKIRDKRIEEEGREKGNYNKSVVEGESEEQRKKRLRNIRQQRYREKLKKQ